jgi:hypothetical protein
VARGMPREEGMDDDDDDPVEQKQQNSFTS